MTDEQKQKLQEHNKACIAESEVDPELVKKFRQGDFADDPKLKLFAFCMSKKLNFQNEAGDINTDVVEAKLTAALGDAAAAKELVQKCLVKKDTSEDTAFETIKCYFQNRKVALL